MLRHLFIIVVICCQTTAGFSQSVDIPKPHKFVGHKIGADKKLFSWLTIYDYLKLLNEKSDRVVLEELGKSTLGKPFILLKISSPFNLRNVAKYKNLQKQAAHPKNLTERDVKKLTVEKKIVVFAAYNSNIHGVASVQGVLEFVYRLATSQSPAVQKMLDNVILLLVPDLNPDGMQKIVEWYNNYLGTSHEGSQLPGLTHKYAGEEIFEDWLGLNLIETKVIASQIYRKWYPEVIISINETEQLPRIVLETDIISHNKEFKQSLSAISGLALNFVTGKTKRPAFEQAANFHNQTFFNISAAKTLIGTPLYFPVGSDATQKLPKLSGKSWPGGWWGMRDIIDTEIAIVFSVLDWVSSNKEKIIEDFCVKNIEITEGETDLTSSYFVSENQHDPSALYSMLNFLKQSGVKIYHPGKTFEVGSHVIAATDYIIPRSQSLRRFIDSMFKSSFDSFDLPARYGVKALTLEYIFDTESKEVKYLRKQSTTDFSTKGSYFISNASNDAYVLINRIFSRKKKVFQFNEEVKVAGNTFSPGTIYVPHNEIKTDEFKSIIEDIAVNVQKIDFDFRAKKAFRLYRPKVGLYQPWIPNPDEGWTRLVLEQYGFLYETLYGSKIRTSNLNQYDVIILPDMETGPLISGWKNEANSDFGPSMPRPYIEGITTAGVEKLKKYVREGGTLIALGEVCRFTCRELNLPVREVSKESYNTNPKLLVPININNQHPIAFGMPAKADAVFTNDFHLQPLPWQGKTEVIAHLVDPVQGSINVKEKLPVIMKIPMGEGEVILMSVRPQFRGQIPVTYKLLFNCLLNANSEKVVL